MGIVEDWSKLVATSLNTLFSDQGVDLETSNVTGEIPPNPELGDVAFPMFPYARIVKKSPIMIAQKVSQWFTDHVEGCKAVAKGPYLNLFVEVGDWANKVISEVLLKGDLFGQSNLFHGKKMMIEFSCPNTNKPLHLGHLRNDSLGESLSRLSCACGADVRKVNLINDRGIHICKSMLAYQHFGEGKTPHSEGIKSDHFVGKYYVKYDQWSKEDPNAEVLAREMLVKWEQGDLETVQLWKKMNQWTLSGIEETYNKTGITFDKVYYESKTYMLGKDEILKGVDSGVFYKDDEGTVWVNLEPIGLDKKVLLRKDGTSVYMTQDVGTAINRHMDWPFDSLTYVVASEQQYHFTVLFYVLSLLGYDWAQQLFHLSYGMVNLPEGKMKSREGTVVDADDLFSELSQLAEEEIILKGREDVVGDVKETANAIALGALNYYLLSTNPVKDMIFNPKETLSFQGSTGPYVQYTGARICSILSKYEEKSKQFESVEFDSSLLNLNEERLLLHKMAEFSNLVAMAAAQRNPNLIINLIYEVSRIFSRYYHDNQILNNSDLKLVKARVQLCKAVNQLLKNGFKLVGIPFLERM